MRSDQETRGMSRTVPRCCGSKLAYGGPAAISIAVFGSESLAISPMVTTLADDRRKIGLL